MDRTTVYYGQLPRDSDILTIGQRGMVGLAKLTEAILGTSGAADGLACTPTSPASLAVLLNPGSIYQLAQLEQSPWGSLPIDTHQIVKQGILLDATTQPLNAPPVSGQSWNVLLQVQYSDSDTGNVVLPFYNAQNPSQPFAGPANNGQASSTVRSGAITVNLKYGAAATSGSQPTPTADAGWLGLWVITVANGATQIVSGNIALAANAPFIPAKLPNIQTYITNTATTVINNKLIVGGRIKAFLTSGPFSFPLPSDVSAFGLDLWGGGGGGGGATGNGSQAAASGGGAGDYEGGSYLCQPGSTVSGVIGKGGTGGTAAGGNGSNGGLSSLTYTKPDGTSVTIIAGGGTAALGSTGGGNVNGGVGGTGTGGVVSRPGANGGNPYVVGGGFYNGGAGGQAYTSSATQANVGALGNNGTAPGGGGSGSSGSGATGNGSVGGNGADGTCYIKY